MNVMKGGYGHFKLEKFFGMFFFSVFICFSLIFCNYEKMVGMELILYVCC